MDGGGAQLVIHKQEAIAEELHSKNGSSQPVHVVVKNSPFLMHCEIQSPSDGPDYSLTANPQLRLRAVLLYDDEREKEVDYIKEGTYGLVFDNFILYDFFFKLLERTKRRD